MSGLLDDSTSNGRKLGGVSVGSNPIILLLSGSSSSDGGVGVRSKRNTPLRDVVLFWLVSLRKRGEYRQLDFCYNFEQYHALLTVVVLVLLPPINHICCWVSQQVNMIVRVVRSFDEKIVG